MLETIDLKRSLSKDVYNESIEPLKAEMARLQRQAFEQGMPVTVVFEGWDAAGKGDSISALVNELDPRGFRVHSTGAPTEEEQLRPFLWRFWLKIPPAGGIAVFDRSWYSRVLGERVSGQVQQRNWQQAYQEINQFERELTDDGHVIVKLFLHISKKEQNKRFRQMQETEVEAWRVSKAERNQNKNYDSYLAVVEEMIERTSTADAPWTVVEATDRRYRRIKVLQTVAQAVREGLDRWEERQERRAKALAAQRKSATVSVENESTESNEEDNGGRSPIDDLPSVLDRVDLTSSLTGKEYRSSLKELQSRLRTLGFECNQRRQPVIIAFEGWDASGKGGNIKRITENLDPRIYEVVPISAPKGDEAVRHYLWRFWRALPKAGHIAIFDRTWYGRVLVERVENFATKEEWRRAYQEINEFEQMLVNWGAVVVKFWIHLSKEEQLARFSSRQERPDKQHKITEEDWRNREKWDLYEEAVAEMIERTSTSYAPWTIIEGEQKKWARIRGLQTVVDAIEGGLNR